ncbi:MAG: hypothetical protein ACO1N8_06395 [Methylophilus sp.]
MMRIIAHTVRQFASSMLALMPPGSAWRWPLGGLGDRLFIGLSGELTRLELASQAVLDRAIITHQPQTMLFTIEDYRSVAAKALVVRMQAPPRYFAAGSKVGDRLFSAAGVANPNASMTYPMLQVDHLVGTFGAGAKVGVRVWSERHRYILRVRYLKGFVLAESVFNALNDFKQAHVYLWFEDISGVGGELNYAQN